MLRSLGYGAVSPNSASQFETYFDTAVIDESFCLTFVSDEEISETDCFCHSRACQNIQQKKCEIHFFVFFVSMFRFKIFDLGFFDFSSWRLSSCYFDFSILIIDKNFWYL